MRRIDQEHLHVPVQQMNNRLPIFSGPLQGHMRDPRCNRPVGQRQQVAGQRGEFLELDEAIRLTAETLRLVEGLVRGNRLGLAPVKAVAQAGRGHGQLVVAVGEASVGKSHLLEEGVHTLQAHGLAPNEAVPLVAALLSVPLSVQSGIFPLTRQ
jgi:hypothetical protein